MSPTTPPATPPANPLATTIPTALLETVLNRLAVLFLTGAAGNHEAARDAAAHMLACYHPETSDELRLAANIISFSFQALEALSQAATPDMSLTRILRLRGSAVTLNRESAKAERRLAELQHARRNAPTEPAEVQPEVAEPSPDPTARIEQAIALIQETAEISIAAETNNQTWDQAHDQRQREARIAASLQRAEARVAALANAPNQPVPPPPGETTNHHPA